MTKNIPLQGSAFVAGSSFVLSKVAGVWAHGAEWLARNAMPLHRPVTLIALCLISVGSAFGQKSVCKGQILIEWNNNAISDRLAEQMLEKAEEKVRKDGYCITHVDMYNKLGKRNEDAISAARSRLEGSGVTVYEYESRPVSRTRSIVVSQGCWSAKGYKPTTIMFYSADLRCYDFSILTLDVGDLEGPAPNGPEGWANELENASDLFQSLGSKSP